MSWAHPEFRVSAFTVSGNAFGVVAPSNEGRNGEGALEFRGVPYRDSVPLGTLVLSSGLGGVFPKGIPVGTVIGDGTGGGRVGAGLPAASRRKSRLCGPRVDPGRRAAARSGPRIPQRLAARSNAAGFDRTAAPGRLGGPGGPRRTGGAP